MAGYFLIDATSALALAFGAMSDAAESQTTVKIFRREIDDYIDASGLPATDFGKHAMSDPNFVFLMRQGRDIKTATLDKVRRWMQDNPPARWR